MQEYVDATVHWVLNEKTKHQMDLVYKGVTMVAREALEVFNWRMLSERSEGLAIIDVAKMRKQTKWKDSEDEYGSEGESSEEESNSGQSNQSEERKSNRSNHSGSVRSFDSDKEEEDEDSHKEKDRENKKKSKERMTEAKFFESFEEDFTNEERNKILKFVTGKSRMNKSNFQFQIKLFEKKKKDTDLPKAHTCYNLLDLPNYATREIFVKQMIKAYTWSGTIDDD